MASPEPRRASSSALSGNEATSVDEIMPDDAHFRKFHPVYSEPILDITLQCIKISARHHFMSNTNPRAYLMRRLMADLYTLGFVLDARWPRVLILIHRKYTHTPIDGGREVTGVKQWGRTRRTQARCARARAAEQ